ncbi:MAG: hypothetical protein IPL61_19990 [Myxococcales bacterium]|nr:hypothetical protein [Myxococcales bacterium]
MPRPLILGLAALCGACTIVYDADNLPPPTDATDAPVVDAVPIDADPTLLTLASVEPASVAEGVGAGGGRPVLVVLHGQSLVGDAVVTAELIGGGDTPTVTGFVASADGTEAALELRVPVLTDLGAGAMRTLRLTVTQGAVAATIDVTVLGLAELTLTGPTATASAMPQVYSRIEITGDVRWTGADPVRLVATADVRVAARLDGGAQGTTPGPHGNAGGAAATDGDYTPGGGSRGTTNNGLGLSGSGGGGGGFGAAGTGGSGDSAGGPGGVTGNDMLVPLVSVTGAAGNRGNGGGGGGAALTSMGGVGGGGGGVVALSAGGDIVVEGAGAIAAAGGTSNGGSGGGGGGSGGAILVRAGGVITAAGAWLSAPGGGASTGATNAGGRGGVGRIRIDVGSGDVGAMAANPGAIRGPAWATTTPVIAPSLTSLTLTGQPGRAFPIRLNDTAAGDASPGLDGTVAVTDLAFRRGRNQVCAVALAGSLVAESVSCVDVYLTAP